ncbi:MAG: tetratricopeptide repeat protein, partial [Gammaproteobacteria bacterium]|nr:tetratricopeptide repeat protein [Gammaproteobacteria bacterium]
LETLLSVQQAHPMDNPLVELSEPARTATALGLVVRYAWLLFYPIRLAADYSGGVIAVESGLLAPRALFGLVVVLALSFVVVRAAVRRWRTPAGQSATDHDRGLSQVAFGILLMGLPYLVIGNLLFPVGAIFAERFLYLPSAGFCWLMGLLVQKVHGIELRIGPFRHGRAVVPVILLLLLTSFVLRTWARSADWRDNWTVFRSASRVNPASPRAHFILGRLTLDRGDPEAAIEYFDRTIELYPEHTTAWMEKGNALAALGRYEEAEAMYRETLARSPNYAKAHLNLALALRRQGRSAEAERELSKAALWDPRSATTWAELGNLMLQLERWDEAADAYRRAIALGRTDLGPRLARAESGAASRRR